MLGSVCFMAHRPFMGNLLEVENSFVCRILEMVSPDTFTLEGAACMGAKQGPFSLSWHLRPHKKHGKWWIKILKDNPGAGSDQFLAKAGRTHRTCAVFSKQSGLGIKVNATWLVSCLQKCWTKTGNKAKWEWTQWNNLLFVYYSLTSDRDSTETKSLPGGLCLA